MSRPALRGYTMIELLVVISIIAILAGLLLTTVFAGGEDAKVKQAKMEMNKLASMLAGIMSEDKRIYSKDDPLFPDPAARNKWHCVYIRKKADPDDPDESSTLYKLLDNKGYINEGQLSDWVDEKKDEYEEPDSGGKSLTEWEKPPVETDECRVLADPWGEPYLFFVNDDDKTITIRSFGTDSKDFMVFWPGTVKYPQGTIRSDLTTQYKLPPKSQVMVLDSAEETDLLSDFDDIEVVVYR
ncbi:MAG: type II secretion system protein [Planctomycetes bacterium]|nr:type II secretion system protein [Planctomycetota bacterium]